MTRKEKLFEKGETIFNKEFDIIEILKKIQEIEKLKIILFNSQQLTLFNHLEKPMIYLENDQNKVLNWSPSRKMSEIMNATTRLEGDKRKKFLNYYNNLKDNQNLNEIERRLIELLDKDMENLSKI